MVRGRRFPSLRVLLAAANLVLSWSASVTLAQAPEAKLVIFAAASLKDALDEANAAYRAEKAGYTADSGAVKSIAKVVGATPADVPASLAEYAFPTAAEQATDKWLGGGKDGGVAKALANTAKFLKAQGRITEIPDDFGKFVDPEFAATAAK